MNTNKFDFEAMKKEVERELHEDWVKSTTAILEYFNSRREVEVYNDD